MLQNIDLIEGGEFNIVNTSNQNSLRVCNSGFRGLLDQQ